MIKQTALSVRIEQVRHGEEIAVEVAFDRHAAREWSLGLALLKERLADAFVVKQETGTHLFELQRFDQDRRRAEVDFTESTTRLFLSDGELDHLLHFFLKYFRDGVAEVDHVDVQALSRQTDAECYVTFIVPESTPPVTGAEARRRLGLK